MSGLAAGLALALLGGGATDPILQPTRAALELVPDEDGELGLGEVLARFEAVSDWTILTDAETGRLLEKARFFASGPIRAEPEAVTRTVEALLASSRFYWNVARDAPPRILRVESLEATARTTALENARFVPVAEIASYVEHPALFVQTLVPMAGLDAREVANTLRGYVVVPDMLTFVSMGDPGGILVTGSGRHVANITAPLLEAQGRAVTPSESTSPSTPRVAGEPVIVGGEAGCKTLLELTLLHARRSGQVAILDLESARLLGRAPTGIRRALSVPGAELPELFEELVLERGFLVEETLRGEPAFFTLRKIGQGKPEDARFVRSGSLAACGARPATMFMTRVQLSNLDAGQLSNSLRGMVVDPTTHQFMPVGDALVVRGLGRRLVRFVGVLETADAAAHSHPAADSVPPVHSNPEGGK